MLFYDQDEKISEKTSNIRISINVRIIQCYQTFFIAVSLYSVWYTLIMKKHAWRGEMFVLVQTLSSAMWSINRVVVLKICSRVVAKCQEACFDIGQFGTNNNRENK